MSLATGQITIVDLNDAVSLQGYLSSSYPKVQFLSTAGAYNPDWSSTPVVITAELYVLGNAADIIADPTHVNGAIRWYYKLSGDANYTEIVSGSNGYTISADKAQLTIAANKMNASHLGYQIKCEVDYTHSIALPVLTYKMDIPFSLSQQGATGAAGAASVTGYAWAPGGTVFKNVLGTNPSLTLEFDLFKGGTIVTPTWQWYKQDPTVKNFSTTVAASPTPTTTTFGVASATNCVVGMEIKVNGTQSTFVTNINGTTLTVSPAITAPSSGQAVICKGYDADGGAQWYCLSKIGTTLAGYFETCTSQTMTVYANFVDSLEVFKCIATYSGTKYSDTVAITDTADPYQLNVLSSAGDTFKNGTGSSDVTCFVFQNSSADIDASGTLLTYTWTKNDKDGNADTTWIPYPKVAGLQAKSGATAITYTVASAGANCTINVSAGLVKDRYYYFGTETTPRLVTNVSGTTVTVSPSFAATVGTATAVKEGNYKTIVVTAADIDEKAVFFCDISY